ncbi:MAG: FAD-dependent oxidoreductase [Gammaproteobacteria bacterium]
MIRDPGQLSGETFDTLVIGAGIHGACAAREAALRGLRVAVIDRGDFGCATSHNSLKIAHGGLRYLQHLDFARVRQSVLERRFWLRQAPHIVRPMPFLMPLQGLGTRGPAALLAAMRIHELIGFDRNTGVATSREIPRSRLISASSVRQQIPGIAPQRCTGGAIWHDGQMQDTDALVRLCIEAAVSEGNVACNYMRATKIRIENDQVQGVEAIDQLTGTTIFIACRQILNASGPWISEFLQNAADRSTDFRLQCTKNMNLVVRRPAQQMAFGVSSQRRSDANVGESNRLFFMTPWRGQSIIGTTHFPYEGDTENCVFESHEIDEFLAEFNEAYPAANLARDDVLYCYGGLTPAARTTESGKVQRSHRSEIVDHLKQDGIKGLFSIVGVKYTTARLLAEWAVDASVKQLGVGGRASTSHDTPLPGGAGFDQIDTAARLKQETSDSIDEIEGRFFIETYGTRSVEVLRAGGWSEADGDSLLFRCRTRYSVKHEMAVRLSDVLLRRTDIGARGRLAQSDVDWAAGYMAKELRWTPERTQEELANAASEMERAWMRLGKGDEFTEALTGTRS